MISWQHLLVGTVFGYFKLVSWSFLKLFIFAQIDCHLGSVFLYCFVFSFAVVMIFVLCFVRMCF